MWRTGAKSIWTVLLYLSFLVPRASAIDLDVNNEQSLKDAASQATYGMMLWYGGNETGGNPGAFPTKWWEGAALFSALLNYWHFTGDTIYNSEISAGMQHQAGDKGDYMPSNYSSYLGNDDQMFWGLAAITAAEMKFPDVQGGFSWLSLAQGVFNTQKARWETTTCGGGLRWQLYVYQTGYTMKNSVSNGGFFQLAARLYRYTHDEQYKDWATKVWDWSVSSPLINNKTWEVADSTNMDDNCATAGNAQWTYNYGIYLLGAAYMYNYTTDHMWLDAVNGLLQKSFQTFYPHNGVLEDISCEPWERCNDNEILFKGLVSSWLSSVALLVPSTFNEILPKLQTSATAAAKSCTGNNNNTCGVRWYESKWDGWTGMEEQISASNVFSVSLVKWANWDNAAPVTSTTGGNSSSNANAGEGDDSGQKDKPKPITAGDKAGAGILTAIFVAGWVGLLVFMFVGG
ncbi:uncharacterized protein N7459_005485 [Penicillium hispanicum]|uniref:uncharacterized protein n=1 Tax=Penicillium hispanicum TaxID=1080232 RepID=UPI0025412A7F|nr:uncharacterized protein N7459_005485 [Penicillium hispanicum]KAJ5579500.1 hypothetical protein N7459_005485 [Penicillium hispanicum]